MNTQPTVLTFGSQGAAVTQLQGELIEFGANLAPEELTGASFGPTTRKAVLEFQQKHNLPVTGAVDDITAEFLRRELSTRPETYRVLGLVRHPNGQPGAGLTVQAFDRDLRHEQPLGKTITDQGGFYQITYDRKQFARAEKNSADLIVRVFQRNKKLYDPPLSAVMFNAPPTVVVNIDLPVGDTSTESEYERILRTITPLLDGASPDSLQEDDQHRDITFLAGETGIADYKLAHLGVAQKLGSRDRILPEFFYALLAEDTLIQAGLSGAIGVRFEINLQTELEPLFYDIVLLSPKVVMSAVQRAIADQFVSKVVLKGLDSTLKQLAKYLSEAQTYQKEQRPKLLFQQIERFLSAGKHEEVLGILREDAYGDLPGLLERFQNVAAFSNGQKTRAVTALSLSDALGYDEQIVDRIRKLQGIQRPQDVHKLARLNRAGWQKVLQSAAGSTKPGDRPIRKSLVNLHASALVRKMEKRFPTTAFAAQVERDKTALQDHRNDLLGVFRDHPNFDLATGNIEAVFKQKRKAARSAPARQGSPKESVKAVQRVFKIAPVFRQTKALLENGIRSAAAIHAMGETRFIKSFATKGIFTRKQAREAFHKAADIHTASALLAGQLHATAGAMKIAALNTGVAPAKITAVTQDFPNLKSLFQLNDYCACEECRSVHSAAAYVVDTLQFLKNRLVIDTTAGPGSVKIAKDVLFERRPDLGDMDLSCENTNTPLPYIDVVCELLEEAVSPDPGIAFNGALVSGIVSGALLTVLQANSFPFTAQATVYDADLNGNRIVRDKKVVCKLSPNGGPNNWLIRRLRQTYGKPEEVAAAPQYLNQSAYATLSASKFAFRLPFDLSHQETRAYFVQFDVPRADLMRALQTVAGPQDKDIAAEGLGLSDQERKLIGTAHPANQNTYWNTGSTPAANVMKVVDTFVTKAEIAYPDLEDLLKRRWINPGGAMFIRHLDNTCNLVQKEIRNLDKYALDRLHRFIRLWKKTAWNTSTLDRAIGAPRLGNGLLNDACLIKIQQVGKLQTKLGLSVDELCNLYDTIPAGDDDSRYTQLFLNLAANGTINNDFLPDNVLQNENAENNTPGTGVKLAAYLDYLALCLGSTVSDMTRFVDSLAAPGGPGVILSAKNVAAVYALNLLARTLHLKAADLLILKGLTGIDVLASPNDTLQFLDKVAKVRSSGVSPADLKYLLIHQADNLNDRIFSDDAIESLLEDLQKGYQLAYADNASPFNTSATADENKNAVRGLLAKLPPDPKTNLPSFFEADISKFQTILDDSWQDPGLTEPQFIDLKLSGLVDTVPIKTAQAAIAAAADKNAARNALIKTVADELADFFYQSAKEALLYASVVKNMKVPDDLAAIFLSQARLKQPATAGNRTLLDLLADDALIDRANTPPVPPPILPGPFDNQYRALRLLHKMNLFVATLKLPADRISWMLKNNATLGWLELDNLIYQPGITPVTFARWEQIQDALYLIKTYPAVVNISDAQDPFTVYGLFDLVVTPGTTITDVLSYLSKLAGWDLDALTALDARFGFSSGSLAPYQLPATYLRLEPAVSLLRRLGLDVPSGLLLIKAQLVASDALLMRQALKARYQESEWLGVLKNVQDPLWQQKRDALVAFLLAQNPTLKSTDDLYDYFLIDVEMCSCMPTSRVVQAHATIQLFVQRCLMGLEPRSVANIKEDAAWEQWKWMANFRVWEANRKIFLYPENWIEPELRDDKSELFSELEDTLQQDELTDSAVEDATVGYLEKLDDIAQLDVMATYYQTDIGTMHVFARTKGGDPAVYYYRQFQKERYWTPWEKVNLDITGDHLLAFDRNSRLTLAWPVFTEESDSDQSPPNTPKPDEIPAGGQANQKPRKRWKIQLAVSERANGKWLPKKVSKDGIYSPNGGYFDTLPQTDTYNFFVWGLGAAGQAISCSNIGIGWVGSFALTGCKGYPEPHQGGYFPCYFLPQFKDSTLQSDRFTELNQDATDDLAIKTIFNIGSFDTIVNNTPGIFRVTYPMQMSTIDWILLGIEVLLSKSQFVADRGRLLAIPLGTFMPYFYGDVARTYTIIPGFYERWTENQKNPIEKTFSDIDQFVQDIIALTVKYLQKYQQDPAHDPNKLTKELVADPEYIRLQEEWRLYGSLPFGLKFKNFYHPLICFLRATLNRDGIPALMRRDVQLMNTGFNFHNVYQPSGLVTQPYPIEDIDFELDGAYSSYNWELFFHIPFEIAMRLNRDQRFEEARGWFHYIFNPVGATDAPAPQKYWVTKPFFQTTAADYQEQLIDSIMNAIAADPSGAAISNLKFAVEEWRSKPFKPHVIARSRPVAYQLALVTKYIQNLIDWGDNLFRQFTRESVTQATQMYILADKLLGPKPRIVKPLLPPPPETYDQLESKIDLFGNALLDLENLVPDLNLLPHGGAELPPPAITVSALYFCVPPNDNLLQNWDLVADRLFKIRHCQNIDGVESILALFAPPIDPGALVRAVAGGLDISAFVAGLGASLPNYRFNVMTQKATELVQQVSALGNGLLQALEKRDAEKLARLRSEQEIAVLNAMRTVKLSSISEAQSSVEGLKKSRKITEERKAYYAAQSYMNAWEITAVALSGGSLIGEAAVALGYILSGGLKLIPNFMAGGAGFGGTPTVTATMGGQNIGNSAEMAVQTISSIARALDKAAAMASTQGSYERRQDEWDFQVRVADKELAQIDQQIATANLHVDMLNKELAAHDLQTTNAQQTDAFMRGKYTNQELYDWMIGQISSVYFKAYKLAFDVAKKAERCFGHELGTDTTFLTFGYWDSLKKGLMTAEALHHDIKRMEVAYLDQNKREYELTKHVSLAQLDPTALIQLKNTGKCVLRVPEVAFDLDHPGHYMRRHKSVSLSIPCVAGPYTSVSCKLSLIKNSYRKSAVPLQGAYAEKAGDDPRFVYNIGSIQSIATSSGQSDSGMFELNFHDERYLPFEGTGAIATWLIELPAIFRQFDYGTISDVILHLHYTARDGGSTFKTMVDAEQRDLLNQIITTASATGLFQAYNLRQQFPNEWWKLKQTNSTQVTIGLQHLPFFVQGHTPAIDSVTWFARVNGDPSLYVMSVDGANFNLNRNTDLAKLCIGSSAPITLDTASTLATSDASKLEDLTVLVHFTIAS